MATNSARHSGTESRDTSCARAPSSAPAADALHRQRRRQLRLAALLVAVAAGCAPAIVPSRSTVQEVPPPTRRPAPPGLVAEGKASWYGKEQHGHLTANGERFNMHALTAAHRTLKMNSQVRVVNLRNGRDVVVRINDRGPYAGKRIIDLSYAAAKELGMLEAGVVPVRLEVLR